MLIKPIKFDLSKFRLYEKLKAKQGDAESRFLLFQLLDGSLPFNLENRSVRAYMIKPDGKEVFNDLIINDKYRGYCTLELTNQVLAAAGVVKLELMVTEGTKKLTSSVFELEVAKSINSEKSIVSTNEFTALLNGLASLNEYDNYKNEIKDARGGQTNLKKRLDGFDAHLETIENVNTVISGVITTETNKSFNNSPIIQSFVDNLVINEKLTLPKGEYNCIEPIDLSKLPVGCKIDFQGILKFNNDNDGLIINAINSEIYIQGVYSKYKTYKDIPQNSNSVGIKLISLNKCNVIIKEVIGFNKPISIIGDGTTNEDDSPKYRTKGTIYSDIKIDYLNGKTGLFLDKNYGYLNENVFFVKWLDCYDGVVFNENDTWFDPFNNNKLVYIGLENIEHDGIVLNNCRNSLIQTIRYENIGNKAIIEDKRCSGNVFINNYPINSSKLDLQGLRRVFIGNQGAEDFEPISQIQLTDWSGTSVNINKGYHKELKNNTIYFDYNDDTKVVFDEVFCKVKKSDGSIGTVYFDDYTSDGTLAVTNANATINRKVKIVKVSSSTAECILTTNAEMEQRGHSFYLVCKYKTQPIKIKKSTGTIVVNDIPSTGTYQAMYIEDMWKILKISDDCDSWYF